MKTTNITNTTSTERLRLQKAKTQEYTRKHKARYTQSNPNLICAKRFINKKEKDKGIHTGEARRNQERTNISSLLVKKIHLYFPRSREARLHREYQQKKNPTTLLPTVIERRIISEVVLLLSL